MGIVFRQSVKTSIVTISGAVFGGIILLLQMNILSKQEAGLIRYVSQMGSVIQYFLLLGMFPLVLTFVQRFDKQKERRGAFLTFAALIPLAAIVVFAFVAPFLKPYFISKYQGGDRQGLQTYYYAIILISILWAGCTWFEGYLLSQHKLAASTFMREIVLRVAHLLLIVLYWQNIISYSIMLWGTMAAYGIQFALLFLLARRTKAFYFSTNFSVFTRKEYWEMLHFSWYHLLAGSSIFVISYLDSIVLAPLSRNGVKDVAVYITAGFLVNLFTIPSRTLVSAAYPSLNESHSRGDERKTAKLFERTTLNIFILSVAALLFLGLNLHNAVAVLRKGEGFEDVAPLFFILALGRLAEVGTGPNAEMIGISKWYKFNFRLSILLIVMLVILLRLLIPRYGVYGAAWSTTISLTLFNALKFGFAWWKLRLQPMTRNTLIVAGCGLATAFAVYFIPALLPPVPDAMLRCLLIAGMYGGLLRWTQPSEDLKEYLRSVREKKRLF